jgi:hypothetical protein
MEESGIKDGKKSEKRNEKIYQRMERHRVEG